MNILASRTAGAASLHLSDLILIPLDEVAILATDGATVFDNTSYFSHGMEGFAGYFAGGTSQAGLSYNSNVQGNFITLIPRQDNRIYYLGANRTSFASEPTDYGVTINIDIVPRYSGIRTE
jgi:hypothetical protein